MKYLLLGNGINIQFGGRAYTSEFMMKRIKYRAELGTYDYLFKGSIKSAEILLLLNAFVGIANSLRIGEFDQFCQDTDTKEAVEDFKKRYKNEIKKPHEIMLEDWLLLVHVFYLKHADLEKERNTADNEAQSRIIAQKSAELDEKMEKLADADTVLEAVADTAYREAVKVVAAEAVRETQEQDLMVLEKGRQQVMSPETKMKQKDRELVADWFVRAANTLKKRAKSILEKVIEALRLSATRDAVKAKIKEQTRPSIIELLQNYKQKSQELQAQKPRQHSWEER